MPSTISDRIIKHCTDTSCVSKILQEDPSKSPEQAIKELFGSEHGYVQEEEAKLSTLKDSKPTASSHSNKLDAAHSVPLPPQPTDEDLERVLKCGSFGDTKPSKLFLQMLHDALLPLDEDPLAGVVSPSLLASTGVLPMTVIGPVWDICRHMVRRHHHVQTNDIGPSHCSSGKRGVFRNKLLASL
jgi:hypothetical protein